MKILLTNDDGLHAAQLLPFIKWCQKLGEVTTVVPKYEQSGKSQSIELHQSIEAKEVELEPGIKVWSVDSSPADCVRFAKVALGLNFDLVISGVNRGLNVGIDVMYSGTASAILEAGVLGFSGVALSISPAGYENCIEKLDAVLEIFQKHSLLDKHNLYNVNLPNDTPKGYRFTRTGGAHFTVDFRPEENDMYFPFGDYIYKNQHNLEIDGDAVEDGYISISPMTLQRVDMNVLDILQKEL